MSSSNPASSVGVVPVTTAVLMSGLAVSLTFLSGGFGTGVGSAFLIGPVLIWLIWGEPELASAVGAALIGAAGLACFQLIGALPPPLENVSRQAMLVLPWVFGLAGLSVLVKLRFKPRHVDSEAGEVSPYTEHETELILPDHGPILIFDISRFGRVRTRFGDNSLLPEVQAGQISSEVLVGLDGKPIEMGVTKGPNGEDLILLEMPHDQGRYVLVLKTDEFGLHSQAELDAALRDRTEFFASLGHDLKSPLNAILGFAEMMDMQVRGPMPKAYREYPGLIKEGGQNLERLIADFLDYAKSETGAYEIDPAPLDVGASGDAVMRQSQAAAAKADVRLSLSAQGEVLAMADAGAVRRIWDNLVSNAIKYSATGQEVQLVAVQRGNWVELSVADQGVGMSEADLAMIAAPFAQGSNAKGRAGSGLGLAMVDRLARLHGGHVKIETAPGAGTRVTVSLPAPVPVSQKAAE